MSVLVNAVASVVTLNKAESETPNLLSPEWPDNYRMMKARKNTRRITRQSGNIYLDI